MREFRVMEEVGDGGGDGRFEEEMIGFVRGKVLEVKAKGGREGSRQPWWLA